MSWLSPFPESADRPWRGVWVYASHAVEERLRSWAFWLGLVGLPLLYGVAFLVVDRDEPELGPLIVVAEQDVGDALAAAAEARGVPIERASSIPEQTDRAVLVVRGDAIDQIEPELIVAPGAAESLAWWSADALIREARMDAFLDPTERELLAHTGASQDLEEMATSQLGTLMPLAIVIIAVLFGGMSGFGAAQQLSRVRGKEYFAVLRMGTPTGVIFLGGLAEHALMGALTVVPLALLLVPLLALVLVGLSVIQSELAVRYLLWVPLLALTGATTAFFAVAGVGSVLGSLERGTRSMRGGSGFVFIMLYPVMIPLFPILMERTVERPTPWLFVPIAGAVEAAIGAGSGLGAGWLVVAALAQLPWIVAGVQVGAWAYALDDGPVDDLRRRLRRWRSA